MNLYPLGRVETSADRLVYWYFATPVLQWQIPEADHLFNDRLATAIYARRAQHPQSMQKSNRSGWQSPRDLFSWPEAECTALRDHATDAVRRISGQVMSPEVSSMNVDLETESWANVSPAGAYHVVHAHTAYSWSGVYYVNDGGISADDEGGRMELLDPRANTSIVGLDTKADVRLAIEPRAGLLVVFPSWMQHYVTPHDAEGERISIAFNFFIRPRKAV